MSQNRWRLGLRPKPLLDDLIAFYTLLERMEMREKNEFASNLNLLTTPLTTVVA